MKGTLRKLVIGGAMFGVGAAVNATIAARRRPVREMLDGEAHDYTWNWGRVHYRVKGNGKPVLLVHGIYAGASAYEWRNNYDALAEEYRVYAPDLLGFGLSDKPDAPYTANLYVRLIEDFKRQVIGEEPMILASSLGAAFAIAANQIEPRAAKMALVCPTGVTQLNGPMTPVGWLGYGTMTMPVAGEAIYNAITSMQAIRNYLEQMVYYNRTRVTDDLVEQYHALAHQPGAVNAARAFISGRLNIDISYAFRNLTCPVLLLWGRHARVTPLRDADEFTSRRPGTSLRVFDNSGLLPQDEEPDAFNEAVKAFFGAPVAARDEVEI